MSQADLPVLGDEEVLNLGDMGLAIKAIERAFVAHAAGSFVAPPRHSVRIGVGSLVFTTGGTSDNQAVAGFRVRVDTGRQGLADDQLVGGENQWSQICLEANSHVTDFDAAVVAAIAAFAVSAFAVAVFLVTVTVSVNFSWVEFATAVPVESRVAITALVVTPFVIAASAMPAISHFHQWAASAVRNRR